MPRAFEVWLPLPVPPFTFLAPFGHAETLAGVRVVVPWQGGLRIGVVGEVVEVGVAQALELREAVACIDDRPWLLAPARRMLAAQAARTATPVGLALATMLNVGLDVPLEHLLRLVEGVAPDDLGAEGTALRGGDWHDAETLSAAAVQTWRANGLIEERVRPRPTLARMLCSERPVDLDLDGRAREAQRRAAAWLEEHGPVESAAALARAADVPVGAARALVHKGYAAYRDVPVRPASPPWAAPEGGPSLPMAAPAFSDARRSLVHGGRREERLAALLREVVAVVQARHQALVVVSEAASIDAVAQALASYVPTMTVRAEQAADVRAAAWDEAARGTPLALVGTYTSLCAPLARLGQVHVWDAASPSFKLVAGTRSVVRRDARVLAEAAHVPLVAYDVLATAELRAERPDHVEALPYPPPRLVTADLRESATWPLGSELIRVLGQVAERGRQAVVVVPRRGFAAGLACRACGTPVMCPHCDLPLRWHAQRGRLRCHQCGHNRPAPAGCAHCGGEPLAPLPGAGTEWVAREVGRVVAPLPVWTVDADHRDDLAALAEGRPGVVVGTTAALRIAPPPTLSLLAFTLGDALYAHEDVRAEEQALRTVLAAAELGGDRRPLLLVQTFQSDHLLWRTLAARDLDAAVASFAETTRARRERLGYPPARQWARVQVTHRSRDTAHAAAAGIVQTLRTAGVPDEALLGPVSATVARVRDRYAVHLFLRSSDDVTLALWIERIDRRPGDGVRVVIDVDPYDVSGHLT